METEQSRLGRKSETQAQKRETFGKVGSRTFGKAGSKSRASKKTKAGKRMKTFVVLSLAKTINVWKTVRFIVFFEQQRHDVSKWLQKIAFNEPH